MVDAVGKNIFLAAEFFSFARKIIIISGSQHVIICLLHITCLKNQAPKLKYKKVAFNNSVWM